MSSELGMLVLREVEVAELLAGQDEAVIAVVRRAYELHHRGDTVVPSSAFLRLPGGHGERIIALPAYLGGDMPVAGIKWIASFPQNRARGLERAAGTVILNCTQTGRTLAILGGAAISALRTAASAALAAGVLWRGEPPRGIAVIGCGRISFEILRLLTRRWPSACVRGYDTEPVQLARFGERCASALGVAVTTARSLSEVLMAGVDVMILATTATTPWIDGLGPTPPRLLLHVSLRDLAPAVIAACRNVVDDADHVCRERTSIHVTAEQLGHRRFIAATLGEVLQATDLPPASEAPVVFSPFGLGILDVAVGAFVYERARAHGVGTTIADAVTGAGA